MISESVGFVWLVLLFARKKTDSKAKEREKTQDNIT